MRLTRKDPTCHCDIPAKLVMAGEALMLCHHSADEQVANVEEQLLELMSEFGQQIPPSQLITEPLGKLKEQYIKEAVGDVWPLITDEQRQILTAAFLRYHSIATQLLMATTLREPDG